MFRPIFQLRVWTVFFRFSEALLEPFPKDRSIPVHLRDGPAHEGYVTFLFLFEDESAIVEVSVPEQVRVRF